MGDWNWDKVKTVFAEAYKDWNDDEAPRLGAALAYYTILSLAPLLVVAIAIAGFVLGQEAARGELMTQIGGLVGPEGAKAIEAMIAGAQNKEDGVIASILGMLTLLWGASAVVGELRASLNKVWDVPIHDQGVTGTIKEKSKAMGMVLGFGFLLLVSLVISTAISTIGTLLSSSLPVPEFVLQALNLLASLVVFSFVFAAMFRFLPQANIHWRDVIPGAVFTALLFSIGKSVIGLYLGKASFGSTYGAAGSLVIVLVWVYYSAQLFYFGAEVTHAYAELYGSRAGQRAVPAPAAANTASRDTRKFDPTVAAGGAMMPPVAEHPSRVTAGTGAVLGIGLAATRILKALRGR